MPPLLLKLNVWDQVQAHSVRPSERPDTVEDIERVIPTFWNGQPPKTKVREEAGLGKLASSQKPLNSDWNLTPYVASLMGLALIRFFFPSVSCSHMYKEREKVKAETSFTLRSLGFSQLALKGQIRQRVFCL